MKMRLMFLRDILSEKEECLVRKFHILQVKKPTKGDWASTCAENLKELKITEEIRNMTRNQFKCFLNKKIQEIALKYLLDKRGKKGIEVEYTSIRMADYLVPNNSRLTISEKQQMFAIMNRMVKISYNYPQNNKIDLCYCGQEETMEHIYNCKILNEEEPIISYNQIFKGNIGEQVTILQRFENNMKQREQIQKENFHVILDCDPLYNSIVQ